MLWKELQSYIRFENNYLYMGAQRAHIDHLTDEEVVLVDEDGQPFSMSYNTYRKLKYGPTSRINACLAAHKDFLASSHERTIKGLALPVRIAVSIDLCCLQCGEQSTQCLMTEDCIYKGLLLIMPLCGLCQSKMDKDFDQKVEQIRALLQKQYEPEDVNEVEHEQEEGVL
ncbi:MAG: hypothetical protein E6J34_22665 [Chloroflexi bacterium]|nr:MAG: hypothetical protein E6J34_22665 [Chloroflexota bacterium]